MIIGQLAGVNIKLSPLFFMLLILAALSKQLLMIYILFALVLAHEIGHVIMAKKLNLHVYELELFPLGGRARISSGDEIDPEKEIKLALAGPIVNIMLLSIAMFINSLVSISWHQVATIFIQGNIALIFFNLIPILPLDGGRIYRALLVRNHGFVKATRFILLVSFILIVIIFAIASMGIYYGFASYSLLVIAAFLFISFAMEYRLYRLHFMKHYLSSFKQKEERVWRTNHLTANSNMQAKEILRNLIPGKYNIITIINSNGKVIGKITEVELMQAIYDHGPNIRIGEI